MDRRRTRSAGRPCTTPLCCRCTVLHNARVRAVVPCNSANGSVSGCVCGGVGSVTGGDGGGVQGVSEWGYMKRRAVPRPRSTCPTARTTPRPSASCWGEARPTRRWISGAPCPGPSPVAWPPPGPVTGYRLPVTAMAVRFPTGGITVVLVYPSSHGGRGVVRVVTRAWYNVRSLSKRTSLPQRRSPRRCTWS